MTGPTGSPDPPDRSSTGTSDRLPSARDAASSPSSTAQQPHSIKRHARGYFDRWATYYDRSWLNELVFFPSIRACQDEIRRWSAPRGGAPFRMLDVGCGTGSLLALVSELPQAELLVGLDYSAEMVARAAEKFAQGAGGDRLQAVHGDSERLPFADESFDVLTCCNSFHHYPHQAAVLREFHRVLRPDGLLVLIDGFRDNVIGWVVFDVCVGTVEQNVHHAPWCEVRTMLEQAGLTRILQRKMNVLAPLLVNVAIR